MNNTNQSSKQQPSEPATLCKVNTEQYEKGNNWMIGEAKGFKQRLKETFAVSMAFVAAGAGGVSRLGREVEGKVDHRPDTEIHQCFERVPKETQDSTMQKLGKLGQNVTDILEQVHDAKELSDERKKGIDAVRGKMANAQSTSSPNTGKSTNKGISSFQSKASGQASNASNGSSSGTAKGTSNGQSSGNGQGR